MHLQKKWGPVRAGWEGGRWGTGDSGWSDGGVTRSAGVGSVAGARSHLVTPALQTQTTLYGLFSILAEYRSQLRCFLGRQLQRERSE